MSCNLIKEYTDFNEQNFEQYTKMIMGKYYDNDIFQKYMHKYTSIRYYNEEPEVRATLEYNLNHYLNKIYESDPNIISEFILKIFRFFYYLDNILEFDYNKELNDFVETVNLIRKEKVKINDDNFTTELTNLIKENTKKKEDLINTYNTHDFYLDIKQIPTKDIYNVKIKYELNFPKLYSNYAIRKVWETENISENKFKIELYLLNQIILKDIISGVYHKDYLVDIQPTLLDKEPQLNKTLEILNNNISKELIILKITYNDFIKHKEKILSLIKEGYQFAIKLDDKYKTSKDNKNIIEIFKYIIVKNKEDYNNLVGKNNVITLE